MKHECEHAIHEINQETMDDNIKCDLDGKYCRMAYPNKYKCSKTSVK